MCAAPETMPSASPSCDHHRAEVGDVGDDVAGRARPSTPLCARQLAYSCGEALAPAPGRSGRATCAVVDVDARARRRAARTSASARRASSARRRRGAAAMSAARRMRSSSPSGSTMWRRSAARAVEQLVLEHQRRDRARSGRRRAGRAARRRRRGARTAPARCRSCAARPRVIAALALARDRHRLVRAVLGQDDRRHRAPVDRREQRLRRSQPAGEARSRIRPAARLRRARTARRAARRGGRPGVISERAVLEPLEQVRKRHRADQ